MQSILETCVPRADILTGTFNPEIFTASLSQVVEHYRGQGASIHNLYTDAEPFFREATYPTYGMRTVVSEVLARLAGDTGVPAIHRLETAFGGGKTHTLIALTHLAYRNQDLAHLANDIVIEGIFAPSQLHKLHGVDVVGIAGDEIPVRKPKGAALVPYTLWGEIAYQLGGETLYRTVEDDVTSYAAPGKDYLTQLFQGRRVLIMLDELAQYATRLDAAQPNGADQLAAFLMALHGYARSHPGIAIVLTLAGQRDAFAHQTRKIIDLLSTIRGEAVSEEDAKNIAARAESGLRNVAARDASVAVPVQANEISQVLAKRLFDSINSAAAVDTARAYLDMYAKSAATLPERASREEFRTELIERYPFHPTFIDFLNHKLATLENFQGTRGVLRVLSLAVRNIWKRECAIPLIHTAHLDMGDARLVSEIFGRGGANNLLPALNADIGSVDTNTFAASISRAQLADRRNPHPAGYPLHEYTWKVVFLHSLVGRGEGLTSNLFGITPQDALFEVAFPGMTPPQVDTALAEIEHTAFYLRYNQDRGRYYASLDASINRALEDIRSSLKEEQAKDHLAALARSMVKNDNTFQVVHDVSLPEHVPDKSDRPILGVISLDTEQIDAEAFITTVGPNRPRLQQNFVFLLVPRTVHIQGEVWNEDRVNRTRDTWNQLIELAREVLARRKLRDKPENFGIRSEQLAQEKFEQKTKERELALLTNLTELYDGIWFPGSSGQVVGKEIRAGVGHISQQLYEVLDKEGELVTEVRARTQEALISLGKLFFQVSETPTLNRLREEFKIARRWPVLKSSAVFDMVIREGISRDHWCLFRLHSEESIKPDIFYDRKNPLPFALDLQQEGLAIITPQGAKKRGWDDEEVNSEQVVPWIRDAIAEEPAGYVTGIIRRLEDNHGELPKQAMLDAIDTLVREDRLVSYEGNPEQTEKPETLRHGANAILHKVQPGDAIITPAEAARRGWVTVQSQRFELQGKEAAERLVTLLPRIGTFYGRGAKSAMTVLDIAGLEIRGGGQLRLILQGALPEAMKQLGELFEVLNHVVTPGDQTQGVLWIDDPDDNCPFLQALKKE